MPSGPRLSQKIANDERHIRYKYQLDILGPRERAETRKAEIRGSVLNQSSRGLKARHMRRLAEAGENNYGVRGEYEVYTEILPLTCGLFALETLRYLVPC